VEEACRLVIKPGGPQLSISNPMRWLNGWNVCRSGCWRIELAPNAPTDGKREPRKKKELPYKPSLHKAQCKTLGRAAQFASIRNWLTAAPFFMTGIAETRWFFPTGA